MRELLTITNAIYVDGYVLRLTFSNGEVRLCDFRPMTNEGICKKLQSIDYFKNFTLDPFTVDWNNEIGFAPEYLYEHSVAVDSTLMASEDAATYK